PMAKVAMAGNGRFMVAWSSHGSVYAREYLTDGSAVGGQITVIAATTNGDSAFLYGLAADAIGDFVVLYWLLAGPSASIDDRFNFVWSDSLRPTITAQRYTSTGSTAGDAITVVSPNLINGLASVAMDGTGNFVVVWDDTADVVTMDEAGNTVVYELANHVV